MIDCLDLRSDVEVKTFKGPFALILLSANTGYGVVQHLTCTLILRRYLTFQRFIKSKMQQQFSSVFKIISEVKVTWIHKQLSNPFPC